MGTRRSSVAPDPPLVASPAERLRSLVLADKPKKGPGCTICGLAQDMRAMVEALVAGGHAYTTISRNLKDPSVKIEVSPQTIGQHFLSGHHRADAS